MFNILSSLWYVYVVVMFFVMVPDAISSIEESFVLLFVTSIALVLPEIFRDE